MKCRSSNWCPRAMTRHRLSHLVLVFFCGREKKCTGDGRKWLVVYKKPTRILTREREASQWKSHFLDLAQRWKEKVSVSLCTVRCERGLPASREMVQLDVASCSHSVFPDTWQTSVDASGEKCSPWTFRLFLLQAKCERVQSTWEQTRALTTLRERGRNMLPSETVFHPLYDNKMCNH